ncbi:MAG: SpoIIE family protein phosphatase [Peptococcaceae bacterium]|nr:SpoIIE family protein phosphatase [Peptococcaceae bacterium]
MTAKWLYIEDTIQQANKMDNMICGDYYLCQRTFEHTIFILCDGLGSGIKANISATMCAHRLLWLLESGISLFKSSEMVLAMMHKARTQADIPYAAFTVAWVLNNGQYKVLSYESPSPLLVNKSGAEIMAQRVISLSEEPVKESTGMLRDGEALVLMTDGVTQAGLGKTQGLGWGVEGVNYYLNTALYRGKSLAQASQDIMDKACQLSGGVFADDASLVVLSCRQAKVLNIMTGPPVYPSEDESFVRDFLSREGYKVVCGSTTADIVSRVIGKPVEILSLSSSFAQPPRYKIEGIDLVTEGAVTLNQVYNILDEDPDNYDNGSCVSDLGRMMCHADFINFFVGGARNPSHNNISFKQLGVLPRQTIVNLLVQKLRDMGKIVLEHYR